VEFVCRSRQRLAWFREHVHFRAVGLHVMVAFGFGWVCGLSLSGRELRLASAACVHEYVYPNPDRNVYPFADSDRNARSSDNVHVIVPNLVENGIG